MSHTLVFEEETKSDFVSCFVRRTQELMVSHLESKGGKRDFLSVLSYSFSLNLPLKSCLLKCLVGVAFHLNPSDGRRVREREAGGRVFRG